jgi:hypothetical protein
MARRKEYIKGTGWLLWNEGELEGAGTVINGRCGV